MTLSAPQILGSPSAIAGKSFTTFAIARDLEPTIGIGHIGKPARLYQRVRLGGYDQDFACAQATGGTVVPNRSIIDPSPFYGVTSTPE
jgi:hypothetical protein